MTTLKQPACLLERVVPSVPLIQGQLMAKSLGVNSWSRELICGIITGRDRRHTCILADGAAPRKPPDLATEPSDLPRQATQTSGNTCAPRSLASSPVS